MKSDIQSQLNKRIKLFYKKVLLVESITKYYRFGRRSSRMMDLKGEREALQSNSSETIERALFMQRAEWPCRRGLECFLRVKLCI